MKTIIISDVGGKKDSVIPYGLKLGTYNETEVEIVHIIDPRSSRGVATPYADSQSITPGAKMSHDEIMQREKNQAEKEMDKLLSAEASRLNYPLKINTKVDIDSIETGLKKFLKEHEDSICVMSLNPENTMISDLSEVLNIVGKIEYPLLVVPPGYAFREPAEIYLYTDFSKFSYDPVARALKSFINFPLTIKAFGIDQESMATESEKKRELWEASVNSLLDDRMKLQSQMFIADQRKENVLGHIRQSTAGLVMLPEWMFTQKEFKLRKNADRVKFFSELEMPVLIY